MHKYITEKHIKEDNIVLKFVAGVSTQFLK